MDQALAMSITSHTGREPNDAKPDSVHVAALLRARVPALPSQLPADGPRCRQSELLGICSFKLSPHKLLYWLPVAASLGSSLTAPNP